MENICGPAFEDAVAENARRVIQTYRGAFYPDPNYGSKINTVCDEPRALFALCFARQAVCDMDGVYALSAEETDGRYKLTLSVNGLKRQVKISA
mgnify:FL=1